MAVQIETQGQLREFLEILARRKWQVLLPAALVIALGTAFAVIVPKKFVASTRIELRPVGVSISNKEGGNAKLQIPSRARIKKVVEDLQNAEYLGLPPEGKSDFLDRIQRNITVKVDSTSAQGPGPGATFVDIEYADVQREWAVSFLRALRTDWAENVISRDRKKAEDEAARLREERKKIEKEKRREEEAATELRRKHDLSVNQPLPGATAQRSEDPAFARLQLNQDAAAALERDLAALRVRIVGMEKQLAELPPTLPKVDLVKGVTNAEELAKVEGEIADLKSQQIGIKPAAHRYRILQDAIQAKEAQRDQLKHLVTKGEVQESSVPNPDLAEKRKAIDALKLDESTQKEKLAKLKEAIEVDSDRVQELRPVYKDLGEMEGHIARLQKDLEGADASYNEKQRQLVLLSSPEANPFEVTQDVTTPPKPSEPNPWLIVSFSVVAGLGLGIALAVMLEYNKNCFRTVADISRVMVAPVLGSIDTIVTRRQKRLTTARRVLVGLSSVVVIGAIVFVTWAWANNAHLLAQDVRDAIETLRAKLR